MWNKVNEKYLCHLPHPSLATVAIFGAWEEEEEAQAEGQAKKKKKLKIQKRKTRM